MTFLYPLGLLGLIGIPILILVYIIKSKYTEQTIASTYLWELSERFLKKKRRVSRLTGIIALILQLLAVTLISLAIAHPIITVPNAANAYCFVLDGSGSMRMMAKDQQITRFEAGKQAISDTINGAVDGSVYTLIYVGDTTSLIFEGLEDKDQANLLLNELEPAYNTENFVAALGAAQGYFQENPSILTYLVTDAEYKTATNIQVVNVGGSVENYSLSGISYTHSNSKLTVSGVVTSYESDADVTLGLFIDGGEEARVELDVACAKGMPTMFTLETVCASFADVEVRIMDQDALAEDNSYHFYNVESESSYDTLIVSERPTLIEGVLRALINAKIDVVSIEEYEKMSQKTGYGLYVFDSVNISALSDVPTDGSIWLINTTGSMVGAGYAVQGEMNLDKAGVLEHSNSSSSIAKQLTADMKREEIHITRYIKCGFYRNFTTIMSYQGSPVVFAGTTEYGNREVVFAFDLHQSNLPVKHDYVALMRNLVTYSFPDMVERTDFECGQDAPINIIANCESVRVESPSGEVNYLDAQKASDVIKLKEVGTYKVTMNVAGTVREFSIWSAMKADQTIPTVVENEISLQGEAGNEGFDGKYDPLIVMFIVLAVVFLADWMVYCYEKYQLR